MNNIVFLFLRRMRRPLLTLVVVYAVSILGLVLIPGQDADGNVWYMDIFHAFYFVSFMSTTIGFGEIPFEFSDAQRLWVTLAMYVTVISWLYAIGNILALVQDRNFLNALAENYFARRVKNIRQPYYLICGYGETGSALVKGLTDVGHHVVVIEIDEYRSSLTRMDDLWNYVPTLCGDASIPHNLQISGLQSPFCKGVVAVTNSNEINLMIALSSKLLHPNIKVICRADSHDVEKNMASFNTDYIIDPFDNFALHLSTAFQVPCLDLLRRWLYAGPAKTELQDPIYPPLNHHWVICGYGRFGKALYKRLKQEGLKVVVIEATPEKTGEPQQGVIVGRGTEADTLMQAEILTASGLIAGTDDDANNLSILVTGRELNPDLFCIMRQNQMINTEVIRASKPDMIMHPSNIIADKIRVLLGTPMLHEFISLASYQDNDWACELISRISAMVGVFTPRLEEIEINEDSTEAVHALLRNGGMLTIDDLLRDPWDREQRLQCIVLLLERHNDHILLPDPDTELKAGDRFLICYRHTGLMRLFWTLQQDNTLHYVRTGEVRKRGLIWKYFST